MRLLESVIPVRACHVFLVLVSLYASPSAQAALIELIAVTAAVSATPILSGAVPSPILSRQRLHEAPVQGPQASRKLDCAGRRQAGPWSSMTRGCTRREEGHPNFQSTHKAPVSSHQPHAFLLCYAFIFIYPFYQEILYSNDFVPSSRPFVLLHDSLRGCSADLINSI